MVNGPVAFVLGGGGVLGVAEAGMLRALFRSGIRPDFVFGTSIGAINGALVAADPTEPVTERLVRLWTSPEASEVYGASVARQLSAAHGPHLSAFASAVASAAGA